MSPHCGPVVVTYVLMREVTSSFPWLLMRMFVEGGDISDATWLLITKPSNHFSNKISGSYQKKHY